MPKLLLSMRVLVDFRILFHKMRTSWGLWTVFLKFVVNEFQKILALNFVINFKVDDPFEVVGEVIGQ